MKFLCDVHIAFKVVNHLRKIGHQVRHVNELPKKWITSDAEIIDELESSEEVLITKDADFRNSFFINKKPSRVIRLKLGNLSNKEVLDVLDEVLKRISMIENSSFLIEADQNDIQIFS